MCELPRDLLARLEAARPHLTPVCKSVCTYPRAAAAFDGVVRGLGQVTRQQSNRWLHQPQIESLVAQMHVHDVLPPPPPPQQQQQRQDQTSGPASETGGVRAGAVLLELGAGKGLLGRVMSEVYVSVRVVRTCRAVGR